MIDFLEQYGLPLPEEDIVIFSSILRSHDVYYMDTEFRTNLSCMWEIVVLDWPGKVVLNEFFDCCQQPDVPADIRSKSEHLFHRHNDWIRDPGILTMTPDEVVGIFQDTGFSKFSTLVEWSVKSCDRDRLETLFKLVGKDHMVPLRAHTLRPIRGWYMAMPGLRGHTLSYVYGLLYTDQKEIDDAHQALPDTIMLFWVTQNLLAYQRSAGSLVQTILAWNFDEDISEDEDEE